MPVDKQKLLRFMVLDECFRNGNRRYGIEDLVEVCNREIVRKLDGQAVSKRTIQKDINEMEGEPYNIELDESLRDGHKRIYRYKDLGFSLKLFSVTDEERNRIEGAIDVLKRFERIPQYDWVRFCLQKIAGDQFMTDNRSIISFQNNPDLYGIKHFERLLEATFNRQPLRIVYKPYDRMEGGKMVEREEMEYKVFPYHLKQYNDRWFVMARVDGYETITVFALDRIVSIRNLHVRFEESGIDFEEYFDDTVGVSVRGDAEEVVLRVNKWRYQYIKTKPLHHTQTEIRRLEGDDYVTLRLRCDINNELEALLLSYGDDVEVVEPERLRESIAGRVRRMEKFYEQ